MITPEQVEQIHELRQEGYSIREIAKELGFPKSTVERGLLQAIEGTDPDDDDDDEEADDDLVPTTAAPGGILASQLPAPALPTDPVAQALLVDAAQRYEARRLDEERIEQRKDWFVKKVNRLISELVTNARKTTWDESEADDFILRVDTLKEKLLAFCDKHAIDEEELQIWVVLTELGELMTSHMEENRPWLGSEVEFDLPKGAIQHWKDNKVDSFDDEAYESDEEDDEDIDDDQDDEED